MEGISFEQPTWYILICLLVGLVYALVLYFRDRTFKEQSTYFTYLLGALRFLAVSTLAILLLSPVLRSIQNRTQKPIVVIAQDGSESVTTGWSTADSASYVAEMQSLQNSLAENYEVATYTFGDLVRDTLDFSFTDKRTNLASVLNEVYDLYSNQNLGALILSSDGIYNEGANPAYLNAKINAPVYTIGLGDTTRQKDVSVKRVFHNKIAYLGDKFSVQVDLSAQNAAGSTLPLRISRVENGQTRNFISENVAINKNDFFATREFILDADRPGVNRYRISIGTVAGEQSTANNARDIFVDVLEARQKILLLAYAPHPDIAALKHSMEQGRNNEIEVAYANSFTGNINDFDLVVLHELPNASNDISNTIQLIKTNRIPCWFIAGPGSGFDRLNEAQSLLSINANGNNTNEVQAKIANDFTLFNIDEELRNIVPNFPPVIAPFGDFSSQANASVLLYQQIGRIATEYPLLSLGEVDGTRQAVLAATGIWKWRLFDYLDRQSHDRFNDLVSQVVQYLSVKDDKRRFRVSLAKNIFDENEPIIFDAELYNDNYELINNPSASMIITDEDGREYNYTFNATGNTYRLNAGILPVGNYRYRASTNTGTQTLEFDGLFSVQSVEIEGYELTANHQLLQLLSDQYGGELITPTDINSLPQRLIDKGSVKPVIYQTVNTRAAINLKWIFFLILGLLSIEWFLRRYYGAY